MITASMAVAGYVLAFIVSSGDPASPSITLKMDESESARYVDHETCFAAGVAAMNEATRNPVMVQQRVYVSCLPFPVLRKSAVGATKIGG